MTVDAPDPRMTPGDRIALYRKRAGLTQEQAAQLKGCSLGAWRKWESGEREPSTLGDWIDIARVVRVKDLFRLTGLPVSELPEAAAEHETVPPIRLALHAYAPRLDGEPQLDELLSSITFAWDTWHGSGSRYSRTGIILPDLIRTVRGTLAAVDREQRREASRIATGLYLLVRAYTKRIGALDLAMVAADRASVCAEEVDDPEYRGVAAWNAANVLSARGFSEEAAALLRDAIAELQAIDEPPTSIVALLGSLHLLLALQEARARDERAVQDALATATSAAGSIGETNHHRLVFGPTNVDIHYSAAALEMSRSAEALRIAERIDPAPLPSIERRHSHFLGLATGYAARRDDLAAVHMLLRADREVPEEAGVNLTVRSLTRDLLRRETATTRPELRPFAERIGIA